MYSVFYYDPESPSGLRWAEDRWGGEFYSVLLVEKGAVAGYLNNIGYWQVSFGGKQVAAHRVVWEIHNGRIPDAWIIDHIDGNSGNNKIENLRLATHRMNTQNTRLRSDSSTGVVGVCYSDCERPYYIANWQEEGRRKLKKFSITKYGADRAFELAKAHRELMIGKLNANGENYTERHGGKDAFASN